MRSISKSRVTRRTRRNHATIWSLATSGISEIVGQAETPEQYCQEHIAEIHNFEFISQSRRGINAFGNINLQDFYQDVIMDLVIEAERWCNRAKDYMKTEHRWNNVTGDAERGLSAEVAGIEEGSISMYLYHNIPLERHNNIPYGNILETYTYPHAGFLGVIQPTIEQFAPQLTASLQGVLNR